MGLRTPERFTAWSMCPACQRIDLHSLRAPQPFDRTDPVARTLDDIFTLTSMFDSRLSPSEQSCYEVIRTCRCGHEWGQEPHDPPRPAPPIRSPLTLMQEITPEAAAAVMRG